MTRALRGVIVGALVTVVCTMWVATASARPSASEYRVTGVQGTSRWDYDVTKLDSDGGPHLIYRGYEAATLGLHQRVVTALEGRRVNVSIPLAGPVVGEMNWTNPDGTETCSPAYDLHAVAGNVTVELRRAAGGRVAASASLGMTRDLDAAGCSGAVFNVPVGGVFGIARPGLDLSPETPVSGTPGCERDTYKDLCTTLPAGVLSRRRFTVAFASRETETRDPATFTGQLTVAHTLKVTFERVRRSSRARR